ncbi:MAG TPA: hypothetical protein VF954_08370 [Acidimicrobiales bacterium]
MGNLLYPMVAVGLSLAGALVLWLRSRKPRTLESGIEEFTRELRALAPDNGAAGHEGDGRHG